MRILVFAVIYTIAAVSLSAAGSDSAAPQRREIILAPVTALVETGEFLYLRATIRNLLRINLEKQETLTLANAGPDYGVQENAPDFDAYLVSLQSAFPNAQAIAAEYYVSRGRLNVLVNVWELETLRIKSSFIETLPADLDMIRNIEAMAAKIAESVGRELPPTGRKAIFDRQVIASLRNRIDREERFTEEVFALSNAVSLTPFSGLSTGRNVVTWSQAGPFVSPVLGIDYARSVADCMQLRFQAELLGFDLLGREADRMEFSLAALAGYRTKSPYSFSLEAGVSASWEYNEASAALAYPLGLDTVYPEASRFSIGIPLALGFTHHVSKNFFYALDFTCNGLAYTFEALSPDEYEIGSKRLRYFFGFSAWNFLCFSISVRTGVRF